MYSKTANKSQTLVKSFPYYTFVHLDVFYKNTIIQKAIIFATILPIKYKDDTFNKDYVNTRQIFQIIP